MGCSGGDSDIRVAGCGGTGWTNVGVAVENTLGVSGLETK